MAFLSRSRLVEVGVAVALLAAYHATFGAGARRAAAPNAGEAEDLASLARDVEGLAAAVAARDAARLPPDVGERIDALEERVRGLPGADGAPAAPAGRPWTEADLDGVRRMLDAIAARKAREREEKAIRRQLAKVDATLSEAQVRAAIPAITEYNEAVAALVRKAIAAGAAASRSDFLADADALRRGLERDLMAALPAATVEKVIPPLPDFPVASEPSSRTEPAGQPPGMRFR